MSILEKYRKWEGNIEELIKVAGLVLRDQSRGEQASELSVRLVRDYAQRGIISRAERAGKEARYEFRHLVELVASRTLLADGWPLAKIADYFATSSDEALLALIPGEGNDNRALSLVRGLLAKDSLVDGLAEPAVSYSREPVPLDQFTDRAAEMATRRKALHSSLAALGSSEEEMQRRAVTRLRITEWCDVLIDTARYETLTMEEADALGHAIALSIFHQSSRKRGV